MTPGIFLPPYFCPRRFLAELTPLLPNDQHQRQEAAALTLKMLLAETAASCPLHALVRSYEHHVPALSDTTSPTRCPIRASLRPPAAGAGRQ